MERVRIGVVGCGDIAQVQHLPFLLDLAEEFEVAVVCDVSPSLAAHAADRFHVPRHVTDYRDVLNSDVDAVLLCHTDPKTGTAVAALDAGKHLFIEKPMCSSVEEADEIVAAADRSGQVALVGYVKLYEPAYQAAQGEVAAMDDVRFVQVNHLHPNNLLHIGQFRTRKFEDVPKDVIERTAHAKEKAVRAAIGDAPPDVRRSFSTVSGSMIHDLYGLREMFGNPSRVVSTNVWGGGSAISTTLEYPQGYSCVATWVDLPDLWDFRETLEVYGDHRRVLVSYPTGFARGILSRVVIQGTDERGSAFRTEPAVDWESAFLRELRHFHECIVGGTPNRTPLAAARDDIRLIIDIVQKYPG